MIDQLAAHEKAKYERVWSHDAYRKTSPGERECPDAFAGLGMQVGDTLIDFGAGSGRATRWFRERGVDALAVDLADNALEVEVPFVGACLWSLPSATVLPPSKYGFCSDVMEHIPEAKVPAVLVNIAQRVQRAAWFRIATRHDVMGPRLIGEALHLTVRNEAWWRDRLVEAFDYVRTIRHDGRDVVFATGSGRTEQGWLP